MSDVVPLTVGRQGVERKEEGFGGALKVPLTHLFSLCVNLFRGSSPARFFFNPGESFCSAPG